MESTQIQALYEPPLAAMPQLREKPRQGFETWKTAWKPGPNVPNFTVALGLRAVVVENGVRETYSARYYNPNTGRFLSRDPNEGNAYDPKALHKYLYASGDPVNRIDPLGRADLFETGARLAKDAAKAALVQAVYGFTVVKLIADAVKVIENPSLGNVLGATADAGLFITTAIIASVIIAE
jgi:RHS repeat-associated protein